MRQLLALLGARVILGQRLEFLFKELFAEAERSVVKREQILKWLRSLIEKIEKSPRPSRQA